MDDGECFACSKPLGTGTLLDFQPDVPPAAAALPLSQEAWEKFAKRYKCPICAELEHERT